MKVGRPLARAGRVMLLVIPLFLLGEYVRAHCDGLDGPVVKAAEHALATGNVNYALIWVRPEDEAELRDTFRAVLAARTAGEDARAVADRHFFETLVRLHRAGEGAPYTGLKPAGRDLGPAIPAADLAVESGDLDSLEELLVEEATHGLRARFGELRAKRLYDVDDVTSGREFVEAYVAFVHYVEGIHEAATLPTDGHYPEEAEGR